MSTACQQCRSLEAAGFEWFSNYMGKAALCNSQDTTTGKEELYCGSCQANNRPVTDSRRSQSTLGEIGMMMIPSKAITVRAEAA